MQKIPLKFMATIFLDAKVIEPSASVYPKLYDVLDETYVPATIQELTQNGSQNRIVMENREVGIKVIFLSNKIIFEKYSTNLEGTSIGTFNDFCDFVSSATESLFQHFTLIGHRLSFVTKFLLKGEESEQTTIANRLLKFPPSYTPEETFEWNWRIVKHTEQQFSDLSESMNYISSINRLSGKLTNNGVEEEFKALDIEFDFNTVQENNSLRFNVREVKEFYQNAPTWYDEHYRSIMDYIGFEG